MKFIGELFELSWLFWQVWWWDLRESNKVRKQFYTNALVASIDKSIRKKYRYRSPFLISKLFLQQKGNVEVHRYGETPLTSLDEIAKRVQLEDTDCWMELGSGRSRGVFFLAARYKCRGVGVEWIPEFVLKSLSILKLFPNMNVSIYLSDFLKMDYTKATVIYVYGLCLEEIVLEQLVAPDLTGRGFDGLHGLEAQGLVLDVHDGHVRHLADSFTVELPAFGDA